MSKKGFYGKLAWMGIRKNKKLYTPYILTCIGMVMMAYIIAFLESSPVLASIAGGSTMQAILGLGYGVMSIFSLIFLFYTNSFLIRRRKKEFGLYNILGMGKWNLARVLLWESIMISLFAIGAGLLAGVMFSKMAELVMVNILRGAVSFSITVDWKAMGKTAQLFGMIFLLLFCNGLRQIHLTNPIELLHSESVGERPPKGNWILAAAGILILGGAYWLAVTIQDPLSALMMFFVAVVMVIIATYLLFISGSVTLCRFLQKRKNYYYKTNHFVSVSSMAYRMKRNGAGLASICILCTMVLVMVSSTVCLYMGAEDSLRTQYPRNINLDTTVSQLSFLTPEAKDEVRNLSKETAEKYGQELYNVLDYQVAALAACVEGNRIQSASSSLYYLDHGSLSSVWQIYLVPLEDYNKLMGQAETLNPGEVLLYVTEIGNYEEDTIAIGEGEPFRIKKRVSDFQDNGVDTIQMIPAMYLFVEDFPETVASLSQLAEGSFYENTNLHWYYGFDLDCSGETQIQIQNELEAAVQAMESSGGEGTQHFSVSCQGVAKERDSFYGMYGGLFFLGILLGIVFVFAAVLIIYYKQISEGYEDKSRFTIMQKVGMTKKEIRKSINSQILTVFFLPILTAGLHLAFAFPMIYKLLTLFALTNRRLLIAVTVGCYLLFGLFYILVYRWTSRAYYSIVSEGREEVL